MLKYFLYLVILTFGSVVIIFHWIHEPQHLNLIKKDTVLKMNDSKFPNYQIKNKNNYGENNKFLINNNLAQYSSYIIIDKEYNETRYRIEAFVQFNDNYVKYFGSKENFSCVIKLRREIIEVAANDSPRFYWENDNKKLIFNLNSHKFSTNDLNNILVAVIWKHDFNMSLNIKSFKNRKLKLEYPVILPYSLIKYQKPTIVNTIEPRLKSISFCVHYVYRIPPQFFNWIDLHLSFGVREIIMYDALKNKEVTQLIKNRYGNDKRIMVKPYSMTFEDLCSQTVLFNQFYRNNLSLPKTLKSYLLKSCKKFYDLAFHEKYETRSRHEQLTSNDCFAILKQKHEFIGYYDLDEFVFPRNLDTLKDFYGKKSYYSRESFGSICETMPFAYSRKSSNSDVSKYDYYYNYITDLISNNRNGHLVNQLGSIGFAHGGFLIPNDMEKQFMKDLGSILQNIYNRTNPSSLFPLKIFLGKPTDKRFRSFLIEEDDIEYIEYLYKSYNNFISCVYDKYLNKIDKIDKSLVRYLYYLSEDSERMGKAIHYYKNVKSLWLHYAEESFLVHWAFSASPYHGHFLPHFKDDIAEIFSLDRFNGSIRKLNIDFEYVFYLLNNFTNFCRNHSSIRII